MSRHIINDVLPSELLGKIFEFYMSPFSRRQRYKKLPTIYSVCRWWRNVTLSTSSLWCHLDIDDANTHPPTSLLELYLERSANALLHISLVLGMVWSDDDDEPGYQVQEYTQNVLAILLPHIHRWRVLRYTHLYKVYAVFQQMLLSIPFSRATVLEEVHLFVYLAEQEETTVLPIIGSAPALRKFRWKRIGRGVSLLDLSPVASFPWSRLHHLDLVLPLFTPEESSMFLSQCTLLITFKFDPGDALPNTPFPLIRLSKLRALHLSARADFVDPFINSLDCPEMKVLHFTVDWRVTEGQWKSFLEGLSHISFLPQYLKLSAEGSSRRDLIHQFLSVPRVVNIPIVQLSIPIKFKWSVVYFRTAIASYVNRPTVECQIVEVERVHVGWVDSQILHALESDCELGAFDLSPTAVLT